MRCVAWICAAMVASVVACKPTSEPLATQREATSKPQADAGATGDESSKAKLRSAAFEGSLCREESVSSSISDDGYTATFTFSEAEVQPDDPEKLSSGSCRIALALEVPDGVQFRNATIFPQGFAFGSDGSSNMAVGYSYPATGERQVVEHSDLSGDDDFVFSDRFDISWSPTCGEHAGKPLALELDFDLSATGDAYLNVASIDLNFDSDSTLEWRRCGATR